MRVIMSGGGTGGHIYPAIAIADEIKKRDKDAEILFVGAEKGLEKKIVPESGYDIELITVEGIDRKNLLKNVKVFHDLRKGSGKAKKIIEEFRPDVVIGTGGYASAPVVRMAQRMKIPTYIHEQNAFPGITNKMLENHVNKVFLGFEEGSRYFKQVEKHVVSGNPVRENFARQDKAEARKQLGFKARDFVLLAFGGSQGAGRINKAMMKVIETFNGVKGFQICLATGNFYYDAILDELADRGIELGDNVKIMEYIHNMDQYLAASDLVISRSGALTVAEVTVCGKPAIFIPSPLVTGDHQYHNARAVSEKGGAMVIEEKNLENEKLVSTILSLKNNPEILKDMSKKSLQCAPVDAAGIICDAIDDDLEIQ
ncbi:MAG: undecaprenyldiphospho-muramoylpentapeptide beta-N-acetylglucosaminyltransferase [Bacillota bacterium]|nr:undecaprenyldiphospho-muramoylpentapeptide beta-N-acetylglucosaminyltransferase [Bacillota bacterium]